MGNSCCQTVPSQTAENQIDILQEKKTSPESLDFFKEGIY